MTDFTTDTPVKARQSAGSNALEYRIYFAIIFLFTLPTATLMGALAALGLVEKRTHGPIKTAWSQAGVITPIIFSV